uniref:ORF6N domain-containing protein n=1 Tax=[Lactobacillus] rogosae TaxID=706562 RepID=UPI00402AC029
MELPQILEVKGIRVLTSKQLAEAYKTTTDTIKTNFNANKHRFVEGKHYIVLVGDELKAFKKQVRNPYLVANRASHLYLWTEKGALLHAKSLSTDKAWQVYDYLVDFYFRAKEKSTEIIKPQEPFNKVTMKNPILIFKVLTQIAEQNNMKIRSYDFKASPSYLKGDRIGMKSNMTLEEVDYELAYILAHFFIHKGEGDLIHNPDYKIYNARAERAADMIIKMLDIAFA